MFDLMQDLEGSNRSSEVGLTAVQMARKALLQAVEALPRQINYLP
jgi:hypothetical protein